MRRRTLPRILAVGALVLALAGCVRFQADLNLNTDNTVDGSIVVAVVVAEETEEARATALTQAGDVESQLLGSLRDAAGVSTTEYEEDGYLGSRITFDDVALDAFSGQRPESLKFTRDGDQYLFTGVLDFSAQSIPDDEGDDDGTNLTVTVTFPGEVSEHNGELAGTTVSWTTSIDQRLEMSARGAAAPAGPPVLLIVLVVVGILVLAAAVVAVLLFLRSRRAKAAVAAPETASEVVTPEVEAPVATPDPEAPAPAKKPRSPKTPPPDSVE
jgi:hypothetical protein